MRLYFNKLYTTRAKRPPLKAIVLFSRLEPERLKEVTHARKRLKRYEVDVSPLDQDLFRIDLSRDIRGRIFEGSLLLDTSEKGIWIAFTNEETYFVRHIAEIFFDRLYPAVSRLYLNYYQIRDFMGEIRDAYRGKTTITNFTLKRRPKKWRLRFAPSKDRRGTLTLWEYDSEEELLTQSRDYRLTIDRLIFDIKSEKGIVLLQASITRKGLCKLRFGDFTSFYEHVVLKAIHLGMRWKGFYDKRERTIEDGEIKLNPFSIVYKGKLANKVQELLGDGEVVDISKN